MIPKSHRHLASKNQSFVEKEAENFQKTQQMNTSSRKPVFLNNFHLTPEVLYFITKPNNNNYRKRRKKIVLTRQMKV